MKVFNRFIDWKGKFQEDLDKAKSWQKEKIDVFNKYIQGKQKYIIIGTITGVIVAGASFGILLYKDNSVTLYHVYLDGAKIGTVNDKAIIENWQSQELMKANAIYEDVNLETVNSITFEEEVKFKGSFDNYGTLTELKNKMEIQASGVEVIIDGKAVGVVKDQETADRIINNIKQSYMPKSEKGTVVASSTSNSSNQELTLENVGIKEELTTEEIKVSPDEVLSEEEMYTLLQKGTLEEKIYVVQPGDTISEIAVKFGLTTKEIYQLNPGLQGELINIGDELIVTAMKPLITVETEEKLVQIESIPYKVVYEKDSSMYVNESKVVTKGKEGKKEVEYHQIKENGIVVEREILKETVLEEPVDKVIVRGTKAVPSRGSGVLSWPTVGGHITSYYGPRWGSFHEGIDISGVSDKTIKAADSGTVTFAGWKGGYGYTVIIDHGNGYKTLYGHLSSISVSNGSKVAKGQKIGVMGNTGKSTGTHLHFEVIVNGVNKNPLNYVGK